MDGFTLNFSWKRVVCLIVLLVIYYFLGGFTPLDTRGTGYSVGQFNRVWSYMMLLYCSGAISITLVEHYIGMFPPTSLRFLYVILGLILMGASVAWLISTKQAIEKKAPLFTLNIVAESYRKGTAPLPDSSTSSE